MVNEGFTPEEAIIDIIMRTEKKIKNIFEQSPILEASYREEAYFEIAKILCPNCSD